MILRRNDFGYDGIVSDNDKNRRFAAETANVPLTVSSFHAAAETHLYATETNKSGVVFKPVLLGIANIYNMHSADEKIERESLVKGYALLKEIFKQINA